jgi:type VI secretion system protein VasG
MPPLSREAVAAKLNPLCRRTLEGALGLCVSRTNYNVEIEHWLTKLLEEPGGDVPRVLRHYDVDAARVGRDLARFLDRLKTGNARPLALSPDITDVMREAWALGSLEYDAPRIRSGLLLLAMLTERGLLARLESSSPALARIPADQLRKELPQIVAGSEEDEQPPQDRPEGAAGPPAQTPALDQYTLNLTARARAGEIDPVIGRDAEIRQVIDILTRRRQNNPILTGEAGVGKTAVVEGFALRIAAGDVPEPLKGVSLRTLDLGLLQAGAGVKGEFENRLKNVVAEVKASPQPVILFIDEAHTIVGAGGGAGQNDAANLLKPALARGELRTIAATTWAEYKKYFETDAALKRRFHVVKVDEPDEARALRMMRGLAGTLEKHHKVRLLDEAIEGAVRLSARYIAERQLPDKAVSLLDTACARVALSQSATPPALEDCTREIELLDTEIRVLGREKAAGADHGERLEELAERRRAAEERRAALVKRLEQERALVERILALQAGLEKDGGPDGRPRPDPAELSALREELARLQGEAPLVFPVVDRQAVAEVVSGWTGIPVGKMVVNEIRTVLGLRSHLEKRVIGQTAALDVIARRIQTARANLVDPRRPVGTFLLVGPSGVGKTETALALGEALYGGDRNIIVINMSEYKESHMVSRLKGTAKGYVGYGEGGVLTEAVRRRPHSLVLLDEVEKAHTDVQELFYQVFDKGTLQDDRDNVVDFKNTIILLTSNVGTDTIAKKCADPETCPSAEALAELLRPDLLKAFKPALLGRLTVVPYFPLGDQVLRDIVRLQLGRIGDRLRANHKASFTYDPAVVDTVASRCKEVESGARNVDAILTGTLLPEVSRMLLERMAEGRPVAAVRVGVGPDGRFTYELQDAAAR